MAEHLAELTTLMVEGARAGAGRLQPRRDAFDLSRLIAGLVASLKIRAEAKNLACDTAIAAGLPNHVVGDPVLLRSALENLLGNAVKFTERGKVTLTVTGIALRDTLRLTFAVSDSGIGMTAAETRRVFRPFVQANRDVSSKFGGTGLGLAQVRRLARAMGGDVTAASTPGQGSAFRLTVAVARAAPSADSSGGLGLGPAAPALHVLCVEDNPHGRVVMNAMLVELGHRVDFAGSDEAAVAAVARGGFDAVLMDITHGINGLEALQRIRELPGEAAGVPVIGISPSDLPAADAAFAMNAHLAKPVSPRALAQALARVTTSRT